MTITDVSRGASLPPMLEWKRVSDMRKASTCGRYVVDRVQSYDNYLAMNYRYHAKRTGKASDGPDIEPRALFADTFETFDLAAAACERDLSDQPQPKGK